MPCAPSTKIEPDIRGLDPAIHLYASILLMDARVKPAHDESIQTDNKIGLS